MLVLKKKFKKGIRNEDGQAMVEAAFALPIVLLLFGGCLQLIQIGIGTVVVKVAVYEAARDAHMNQQNLDHGRQIATEICKTLSKGNTSFTFEQETYTVEHELDALIPVLKDIKIMQSVPAYLFYAGEGQ